LQACIFDAVVRRDAQVILCRILPARHNDAPKLRSPIRKGARGDRPPRNLAADSMDNECEVRQSRAAVLI
jgi:hypothetical protein